MRRPDSIDLAHAVGVALAQAAVMIFVVAVTALWCGIISGMI